MFQNGACYIKVSTDEQAEYSIVLHSIINNGKI